MKGPMKIRRDKCYTNATVSKSQLYKLKNQTNKVSTIIKQDVIDFFSKYFCTPFY